MRQGSFIGWPFTWPESVAQFVFIGGVIGIGDRFGFVYALVASIIGGGLLGAIFRASRQRRAQRKTLRISFLFFHRQ